MKPQRESALWAGVLRTLASSSWGRHLVEKRKELGQSFRVQQANCSIKFSRRVVLRPGIRTLAMWSSVDHLITARLQERNGRPAVVISHAKSKHSIHIQFSSWATLLSRLSGGDPVSPRIVGSDSMLRALPTPSGSDLLSYLLRFILRMRYEIPANYRPLLRILEGSNG